MIDKDGVFVLIVLILFLLFIGYIFTLESKKEARVKVAESTLIRLEQKIDKLTVELGYTKGDLEK